MQERLNASHQRLLAAVDGLDPRVLENDEAVGVWSARDVTGNVIDWNWELLWAAQAALGGTTVAHHPIADGEAYNQSKAAQRKDDSWADTRAELDRSFADTLTLLATLTPEQLETDAQAPWGGDVKVGNLFADIAGHADEHTEQLEAWRASGERQ
jgi:hypothetical protein